MNGTQIRDCLHSGQRVYGTHIASLMNPMAAMLATQLDLDFAFFCTEHMPLDRTEVSMMCYLYASKGISPIVRVPTMNATEISMALDAGAQGIVVPYVETVEEVKAAVGAVKYRPIKGRVLDELMSGKAKPNAKTRAFLDTFNREHYLIIGVESVPAMDNLEALISVQGVDGVFLGPHDITVSMGIPTEYENPDFVDAIESVIRRCRAANVGVGLHTNLLRLQPQTLKRFLDAGMNWLLNGADITTMCHEMNRQIHALRQMEDAAFQPSDVTDKNDHAAEPAPAAAVQTCIN